MKKISIIYITLIVLLLSGCSNSAVNNVTKETTDQVQNLTNKNNKYVLLVKNGNPTNYPDAAYGTSFEKFFGSPTWKYFKSDDNRDIVEFTGDCTYQEVEVKARLQFILDEAAGTFEAGALSFNDVPQNQLITAGVFSKVFEDATPKTTETPESTEPAVDAEVTDPITTTSDSSKTDFLVATLPLTDDNFPSLIDENILINSAKDSKFNALGNKTIAEAFSKYFTNGNWVLDSASDDTYYYTVSYLAQTKLPDIENIMISFECNNHKDYLGVSSVVKSSISEGNDKNLTDEEVLSLFKDIYK